METRVERYRKLRQEIQSESGEEITTKMKTSEKVSNMLNDNETESSSKGKISFDKIADAYELYDKGDNVEKDPFKTQKKPFPMALVLSILFASLLVMGIVLILIYLLK